jgi:hypothetical protein
MDGAVKRDQDKLTRLKAGEDVPVGEELDYAAVRAICKNAGWSGSATPLTARRPGRSTAHVAVDH